MPSFVQVVPQRVGLPISGVIGPGDGSSCWQWVRLLGVLLVEGGGKDDGDDGDQQCDLLHDDINVLTPGALRCTWHAWRPGASNVPTLWQSSSGCCCWYHDVGLFENCLLKTFFLVIRLTYNLYEGQGGVQLSWSVKLALRGTVQKGPMELVVVINIHKWNEWVP